MQKPIYEQFYEQIVSQIVNGELNAHYCLPSIRTISKDTNASVITVKKAWEKLEHDGYIYTVAGKGCFVAEYSKKNLSDKKFALAKEKLKEDLEYYATLGLSLDDLIDLIKKTYKSDI